MSSGCCESRAPEAVGPGDVVTITAEIKPGIKLFEWRVEYSFVLFDEPHRVILQVNKNAGQDAQFESAVGYSKVPPMDGENTNDLLFTIEELKRSSDTLAIRVAPTETGTRVFEQCKEEVFNKLKNHLDKGLNLREFLPQHFRRNVNNTGWSALLSKASRSVKIRIVNLTRIRLVLIPRQAVLQGGEWAEFPRDIIMPGGATEFGLLCRNIFTTVSGIVRYAIDGSRGQRFVEVTWEQHTQVFKAKVRKVLCNEYCTYRHVKGVSEALVIVHLQDPEKRFPLQICSAKTVKPVETSTGNKSVIRTDVTAEVLKLLREQEPNQDRHSGSFRRIPSTPVLRLLGLKPSDIVFEITWSIACESFCATFLPHQVLEMSDGEIGGTGDSRVVLNSTWTDESNRLLDNALDFNLFPHEVPSQTEFSREETEDALVTAQREIAQCLWSAAFPVFQKMAGSNEPEKIMRAAEATGLKPEHIWRVHQDVECDLQGILEVLLQNTQHELAGVLNAKGVQMNDLELLQKVANQWVTQDTGGIDAQELEEFLRVACEVATKLRKSSCAKSIASLHSQFFGSKLSGKSCVEQV